MKIGDFDLDNKVFVIAEAGVNHEGKIDNALRLIDDAAHAGVDCIKFQTYHTDKFVLKTNKDRYIQRKKFELSVKQFVKLSKYARERGLRFLTTALDCQSVDEIEKYVSAFKVSSLDICNYKLLEHLLKKQKPLIISTGMHNMTEIKNSMDFIIQKKSRSFLSSSVVLLHCVSAYPVRNPANLNLLSIPYLHDFFNVNVGYSDHSLGIFACLGAVSLGARVIEKHFTINKEMTGVRDHALSADKEEMLELVKGIRYIEQALGKRDKEIMNVEQENKVLMKRSFILNKSLKKNSVIEGIFLEAVVNPGKEGIECGDFLKVAGRELKKDKNQGELLFWDDLK